MAVWAPKVNMLSWFQKNLVRNDHEMQGTVKDFCSLAGRAGA
jgi:hypothetical protein